LTGQIILLIPGIGAQQIFYFLILLHSTALLFNFMLILKISEKMNFSKTQKYILLVHPSLVGYYSWSYSNAFKKDILIESFILTLTYLFLTHWKKNGINTFINLLIGSLLLMPVFMLVHEIVFYLSSVLYLYIFYAILNSTNLKKLIKSYSLKFIVLISLFLSNAFCFVFLILSEPIYDPDETFAAVQKFQPLSFGPFPPLTNNTDSYLNPVFLKWDDKQNFFTYFFSLILFIFYTTIHKG
jgi:hypothetical protein